MSATATEPLESTLNDTIEQIEVTEARLSSMQQNRTVSSTFTGMRRFDDEHLDAAKDLAPLVPNLHIPDYGSRMTSSIYVRGLGARMDNPVVGMYIDGIGIANKNAFDIDFIDIRRADFYRGPQGTLFGRNTIGGMLSLRSLSAFDYQGTRASVGYANHNDADLRIAHYALAGDRVAIAATVNYHHTDGFFHNVYDNSLTDRADNAGARLKTEWSDKENSVSYTNMLSYNFVKQNGFPYHQVGMPVDHNDECSYLRHSLIEGFSFSMPIGQYTLQGTSSYQMLYDRMLMDQDYTRLSYFTLMQQQQEHFVSQELVFTTPTLTSTSGKTAWHSLSGIALSYKYNAMHAPVTFLSDGIDSLILKNANQGIVKAGFPEALKIELEEEQFVIDSRFRTHNLNVSAFHTSYLQWQRWQLEVGLRIDVEHARFNYVSDALIHYNIDYSGISRRPVNTSLNGLIPLTYAELIPRLAVSYNRPTWNIYASIAEGYKAGGFNNQLFSDILQNRMMNDMMSDMGVHFATTQDYKVSEVVTYMPERCLTFEVGSHFNHAIESNHTIKGGLTAYELEVFNQQLTTFPEHGTGRMMTNAGRSRSLGAEAALDYTFRHLRVNATYGFTHATFVNYNNGKQDFAGNFVPYAPQHTASLGLTYTFSFDHDIVHNLALNVNSNAVGPIYWDEANSLKQNFYALLNANINLRMKYVTLQLWGKNLTNTRYDVFHFVSMSRHFLQSGKPIQFGGKILLNF